MESLNKESLNKPGWVATCLTAVGFFCAGAFYIILSCNTIPHGLRVATKFLPCVMLGIWVLYMRFPDISGWLVTGALFCAALGDLLLEGSGDKWFLMGLGANLIAHILYIVGFTVEFPKLKLLRAVLPYLYIAGLLIVLLPNLEGMMAVAVTVYSLVITAMVWRAAAVIGQSGKIRHDEIIGCIGACLFVVCDTLIAVDTFVVPIPDAPYYIMTSYWLGQWGVAYSIVRLYPGQKREKVL